MLSVETKHTNYEGVSNSVLSPESRARAHIAVSSMSIERIATTESVSKTRYYLYD
jgi:hypothetical protein